MASRQTSKRCILQFEEHVIFLSETSKERWLGGIPDRAKNISGKKKNQYLFAQVLENRK
jgi:hypothetical protein